MLSVHQYQILNSCCDGDEIFYFPFAEVNFGGQLFRRSDGDNCARYLEDGPWPILVSVEDVVLDIVYLVNEGFLDCHKVREIKPQRFRLTRIAPEQFSVYESYSCKTFSEHLEKYGYGPHEFHISEKGRHELEKPEYLAYDKQLGSVD
jgi:hypothetical protein